MSKKYIALSAFSSNNAGMLSVNLALTQLLPEKPVFANLETSTKKFGGLLEYNNQIDKAALDSAHVIGWGDFIHCIEWVKIDFHQAKQPIEPAIDRWYELYMLRNVQPAKALSFGSTLYLNSIYQYCDPVYTRAFRELREKCSLLAFRDPVSVAQIKNLMNIEVTLGCDCAMFLQSDNVPGMNQIHLPTGANQHGYIVVGIGRSGLSSEQARLINGVSLATGLPVLQVNWLNVSSDAEFLHALNLVRNARLCISDIYHLCVNAIREKVPTFCFYRSGFAANTLDDEKKRLLFYSYGLKDFLIDLDQLAFSKAPQTWDLAVQKLLHHASQTAVHETLHTHIPQHITRLREQLLNVI